ncbi:hypothetical protein CTI12_AA461730 [Artemisia annua]|uniref:C3H1-type domain-containing protein n=1 Tax=Artemisia annua TaxID=35608 RepID=A0A2U1L7R7_ARTAN|nr:hypothetical protein CTI12_AA461730 [Artemisia annua]
MAAAAISCTISPKLVDVVIDDITSDYEVWAQLQALFHDNKAARIIQLDNEICNMVIGTLSVTDYFQEIKSKDDRLANLGFTVSDLSLATYTINCLHAKFPELVRIIRHKEPLPTLDQVRSIVILEESDMAQLTHALSSAHLTSSSPTVLVATSTNASKSATMQNSGVELCRNFQRGSCTYCSWCKFAHVTNESKAHSTISGASSNGKPTGSYTRVPPPAARDTSQPNVPAHPYTLRTLQPFWYTRYEMC